MRIPMIHSLTISFADYTIERVPAKRMINCNGSRRGNINELIITNYPVKKTSPEFFSMTQNDEAWGKIFDTPSPPSGN